MANRQASRSLWLLSTAKAGAKAMILRDGTISEGWVGGGCARAAVLQTARHVLRQQGLG